MSNLAEGFERKGRGEKLHLYNVARGSSAEVRSLLYVIQDNYEELSEDAVALQAQAVRVGKLVTGLIRSTESRFPKP